MVLRARLTIKDQHDAKAAELYAKAFRAFDADTSVALAKAWATRMDDVAKSGLCEAALTLARSNHEVLNNCAWHWLTARNLNERAPARALALAQRARDLYAKPDGTFTVDPQVALAYLHTLAIAWSENGDGDEAEAIMERVVAQELGKGWLSDRDAFARAELTRLKRLHEEQARQRARKDKRRLRSQDEPGASTSVKKQQKAAKDAKMETADAGPPSADGDSTAD